MIDIILHRFRVGAYHANATARHFKRSSGVKTGNSIFNQNILDYWESYPLNIFTYPFGYHQNSVTNNTILLYLFYVLFITHIIFICSLRMLNMVVCPTYSHSFLANGPSYAFEYNCSFLIYFTMHILNQFYIRNGFSFKGVLGYCKYCLGRNFLINGRAGRCLTTLSMWVYLMNLALVTVVNPGMLNPGPGSNLSVYFQNIQGLVPFSQLGNSNPMLDVTKCFELKSHLNAAKIDIAVMNETWLKKSILDNEI